MLTWHLCVGLLLSRLRMFMEDDGAVCDCEEIFVTVFPGKPTLFSVDGLIQDSMYVLCPFHLYSAVASHLFLYFSTRFNHLPSKLLPP